MRLTIRSKHPSGDGTDNQEYYDEEEYSSYDDEEEQENREESSVPSPQKAPS